MKSLAVFGCLLLVLAVLSLARAQPAQPAQPPAVVELLEDEANALIPRLDNHPGQEPGVAVRDGKDRYAGTCSLRVTQMQRYCHVIPGWRYPIAKEPKPGEYRYVRFAWKKLGGNGIMLQLCGDEYQKIHRYVSGPSIVGWQAITLNEKAPAEWTVVTRDLFEDFGAFTLMGLAFTPQDGDAGLFDHIYLGRTREDLDKISPAAVAKQPQPWLLPNQLEQFWQDLASPDAALHAPARWQLAASPRESIPFLAKRPHVARLTADEETHVRRLLRELDDDKFDVREQATSALIALGEKVSPLLRQELGTTTSAEVRNRIEKVLQAREESVDRTRGLRVIRILEQIGSAEARLELEALTKRTTDAALRQEAQQAFERLTETRPSSAPR